MAHDIVGYYNRFDIFHLEIDPTPNRPVWIKKPSRCDLEDVDEWSQISQQLEAGDVTPSNDRHAGAGIRPVKP
jgi:hypothetical protein